MQAEPALTPTQGVPWRPLAAITLAVLAAHLLVLQARPGAFSLGAIPGTRPLITRTIQPIPPAAPATPAAEAPVATTAQSLDSQPKATETPANPARAATEKIAEPTPAAPPATDTPNPAPAAEPAPTAPATPAVTPVTTVFSFPGSAYMRFRITGQDKGVANEASAVFHWRTDGREYEVRLEVSKYGFTLREQHSAGRLTATGVAPTRFSDKSRSEQATHFEREKGRISFSNNAPSVPLQPGAQDQLSVLVQLGALLAGDPARYGPGATISVQTASVRDAQEWVFAVLGPEELALPGGTVNAVKLVREPRGEFDQKVEVWLAPEFQYMPVRVRLTRPNGDFVDQQWLSTDKM